jgi:hypothetical protein
MAGRAGDALITNDSIFNTGSKKGYCHSKKELNRSNQKD